MKKRNLCLKSMLTSWKNTSAGLNLVLFNLNLPLKPFFMSFVNALNDPDHNTVEAFYDFYLSNVDQKLFRKIKWGQNFESSISQSEKLVVVLAELSSIFIHMSCSLLLDSLKKLKKTIILFANTDVCPVEMISQLKYSCNSVLTFQSSTFGDVANMNLEVRKNAKGGKSTTEWYRVTMENLILNLASYQKQSNPGADQTSTVEDTVSSLLTFKLSLTESEQRSRANVKLPYFKHQKVEVENSTGATSTGGNSDGAQIVYEADIDDDFDYEDPDDDLDIWNKNFIESIIFVLSFSCAASLFRLLSMLIWMGRNAPSCGIT